MCNYISTDQLWDKVYESFLLPNSPRGKNSMYFDEEFGKVSLTHYNTGLGIKYFSFEGTFYEDTILENINSTSAAFFCFNTADELYMQDRVKKNSVKWNKDICWSGEQFDGHKANSLYSKNSHNISHYIIFENDLFKELIQSNEEFSKSKSVYKGDYIDVNFNNSVNSQQKLLLKEIQKASSMDNKLQELYLESKLLDLVYTTINSVEKPQQNDGIYLSSKDVESLNKAKQILLENMTNPPSLKELSYKSAINEFKLKKGFKQLFGNTVFGYLQEYRLNEAKSLLESNEINIGEASSMVGYKSISHFSKIFKEHFGFTPIEVKKEQRKIYI